MPEPRPVEARIAEVLRDALLPGYEWDAGTSRWVNVNPEHVAEAVAGALAPDIDVVAKALAAVGHYMNGPEFYERMARAAVAAMGWHPEDRS